MEPCEVKLQCISQPSKYTPNTSYLWALYNKNIHINFNVLVIPTSTYSLDRSTVENWIDNYTNENNIFNFTYLDPIEGTNWEQRNYGGGFGNMPWPLISYTIAIFRNVSPFTSTYNPGGSIYHSCSIAYNGTESDLVMGMRILHEMIHSMDIDADQMTSGDVEEFGQYLTDIGSEWAVPFNANPTHYSNNENVQRLYYTWLIQNGAKYSNLQDPFYVYNSSGLKTVALTVSNIYGSITTNQTIDVSANVKVYFSPSYHEGSPSFNVTFHDTSVPQSEILSRTWNFDDGYTSTSASPTHTYSIVGGYSPSLTVTYYGGSKTLTHPNSIIVGLQTRHLSDTFAFKESEEMLSVISIIETIDFATVIVPVCEILIDTLSYIQREVPAIHGILETGHRFAHKISEIGRKIYSKFDELGRKIIKNPTYIDKTGFSTCDTVIELTDIIQFEESATEFATS